MAQPASILTPHQRTVLESIAREQYFTDRYYLAGGTALSEFYLHHRDSEDLDLFTEKQEVDPLMVASFIERNASKLSISSVETKRVYGLHSFFLHFDDSSVLKVDFNYYPFLRIEKGVRFGNLEVESIYDIAVDKVHVIVLKPRARDYIDLFFIIREKGYTFDHLLLQAKAKFDWHLSSLDLGARLIEASQMADYPRMLKPIDHQEWKDFFLEQAKALKPQIFE